MLIDKYGTDFHILSSFFPKKTKNQIKVINENTLAQTQANSADEEKVGEVRKKEINGNFYDVPIGNGRRRSQMKNVINL